MTDTTTPAVNFDQLMEDALDTVERRGRILTAQDRVVQELEHKLYQAQLAQAEVQREFDQACAEVDDLAAYTGYLFETYPNESPTPLEF